MPCTHAANPAPGFRGFYSMDWNALFGIHTPVAELLIRGSAMYWFLFLLFRFVMRRDVGAVGIADVLLLVIIADASQNAMAGEYKSVTEGMILVSTIIGWNLALDWLASHFEIFSKLAAPAPLVLIRNGRLLAANLHKEMLSREDVMEKLRLKGVEDIADVKVARMEATGEISVICHRGAKS